MEVSGATDPRPAWRRFAARLAPRARFRARLDRDPRRWVLALAAAEGLVAFAFQVRGKLRTLDMGAALLVFLGFLALSPALGVLAMLAHGRLLFWTGRLLRGRAAPREIHAAFAWSEVSFVLVAWPLALELPLRAAAAGGEPVPAAVAVGLDLLGLIGEPLSGAATVAVLLGTFLYVQFLAEAQRFSARRAVLNQLLAAAAGLGLLAGGFAVSLALFPRNDFGRILPTAALLVGAAFVVIDLAVRRASRPRPTGAPPPAA